MRVPKHVTLPQPEGELRRANHHANAPGRTWPWPLRAGGSARPSTAARPTGTRSRPRALHTRTQSKGRPRLRSAVAGASRRRAEHAPGRLSRSTPGKERMRQRAAHRCRCTCLQSRLVPDTKGVWGTHQWRWCCRRLTPPARLASCRTPRCARCSRATGPTAAARGPPRWTRRSARRAGWPPRPPRRPSAPSACAWRRRSWRSRAAATCGRGASGGRHRGGVQQAGQARLGRATGEAPATQHQGGTARQEESLEGHPASTTRRTAPSRLKHGSIARRAPVCAGGD